MLNKQYNSTFLSVLISHLLKGGYFMHSVPKEKKILQLHPHLSPGVMNKGAGSQERQAAADEHKWQSQKDPAGDVSSGIWFAGPIVQNPSYYTGAPKPPSIKYKIHPIQKASSRTIVLKTGSGWDLCGV